MIHYIIIQLNINKATCSCTYHDKILINKDALLHGPDLVVFEEDVVQVRHVLESRGIQLGD